MFALLGFIVVIFIWIFAISGEISVRIRNRQYFDNLNKCSKEVVASTDVLHSIADEYIFAESQEDILSQVNDEMVELYGENYRNFIRPFNRLLARDLYGEPGLKLSDFWSQVYLILLAKRGYILELAPWMSQPFNTSYGCLNKHESKRPTRRELDEEWRISTLNAIHAAQIIDRLIKKNHPEIHAELLFTPGFNAVHQGRRVYAEEINDIRYGNLEWNFQLVRDSIQAYNAKSLDCLADIYNLNRSYFSPEIAEISNVEGISSDESKAGIKTKIADNAPVLKKDEKKRRKLYIISGAAAVTALVVLMAYFVIPIVRKVKPSYENMNAALAEIDEMMSEGIGESVSVVERYYAPSSSDIYDSLFGMSGTGRLLREYDDGEFIVTGYVFFTDGKVSAETFSEMIENLEAYYGEATVSGQESDYDGALDDFTEWSVWLFDGSPCESFRVGLSSSDNTIAFSWSDKNAYDFFGDNLLDAKLAELVSIDLFENISEDIESIESAGEKLLGKNIEKLTDGTAADLSYPTTELFGINGTGEFDSSSDEIDCFIFTASDVFDECEFRVLAAQLTDYYGKEPREYEYSRYLNETWFIYSDTDSVFLSLSVDLCTDGTLKFVWSK